MACRNVDAAQSAAKELLKVSINKNGIASPMKLNLSDLKSVVDFANSYAEQYGSRTLTYLVLNAGTVKLVKELSPQNFEHVSLTAALHSNHGLPIHQSVW